MLNSKVKSTVEDYMALPESEMERYELIDGDVYMVPAPTFWHQKTSARLFRLIDHFVSASGFGEVVFAPLDVILSDHDVFQPDILFISRSREHIIAGPNIQGAPDLVVEILSPSTASRDLVQKRAKYEEFGVLEYWVVDLEARTIEVLSAEDGKFVSVGVFSDGAVATSKLLDGLEVEVTGLFS